MWILIRWIQPADLDLHCFNQGIYWVSAGLSTISVNCLEEPAHYTVLTVAESLPCSHTHKGVYNLARAYIPCSHTQTRVYPVHTHTQMYSVARAYPVHTQYTQTYGLTTQTYGLARAIPFSHTQTSQKSLESCLSLPCSHIHKDIQPTLFANTQTYSLARVYPVHTHTEVPSCQSIPCPYTHRGSLARAYPVHRYSLARADPKVVQPTLLAHTQTHTV